MSWGSGKLRIAYAIIASNSGPSFSVYALHAEEDRIGTLIDKAAISVLNEIVHNALTSMNIDVADSRNL